MGELAGPSWGCHLEAVPDVENLDFYLIGDWVPEAGYQGSGVALGDSCYQDPEQNYTPHHCTPNYPSAKPTWSRILVLINVWIVF